MDINKHTNAHTIPFVYGAKYTAANNGGVSKLRIQKSFLSY